MSDGGQLSNDKPLNRDDQADHLDRGQATANDNPKSATFELVLLTAVIVFFLIGVDFAVGIWFLTQNHQADSQGSFSQI